MAPPRRNTPPVAEYDFAADDSRYATMFAYAPADVDGAAPQAPAAMPAPFDQQPMLADTKYCCRCSRPPYRVPEDEVSATASRRLTLLIADTASLVLRRQRYSRHVFDNILPL